MNKPQEIFEHSYTCVFNNNYHFVTTIRKDVNNRVTGANIDINFYSNSVGRLKKLIIKEIKLYMYMIILIFVVT